MQTQDYFIANSKVVFTMKAGRQTVRLMLRFFMYFFAFIGISTFLLMYQYVKENLNWVLGNLFITIALAILFYYLAKKTAKISIEVFENGYVKVYESGFKYHIFLLKNISVIVPMIFRSRICGYKFIDRNHNLLGLIQITFFTKDQIRTLVEYIKKNNPAFKPTNLEDFE